MQIVKGFACRARSFAVDRRGTVTIISAFVLPVLIGIGALVAEFGFGLLTRVQNQRVADIAAYAGAIAYNATGSTTTMNSTVSRLAVLNGLASTAVSGQVITSPSGTGNQAVAATVTTNQQLLLAPVLSSLSTLAPTAGASVEMASQASACIFAISSAGTGVTLSGGTQVVAPGCAVASNATVTVPCGTSIKTKAVNYYASTPPSQPCNGIVPPTGTASVKINKVLTTDPLASYAGVTAATSRLATVNGYAAITAPTMTSVPAGTNIDFGWDQNATKNAATSAGCTATWDGSSNKWTLTCPGGSTKNFGNITMGGGIQLAFNPSGLSTNVYNISGSITTASTTTFGQGTYNVSGSITTAGTTTFAAGTYNVGGNVSTSGTTTFGAGTYKLVGGLTLGGGATTTFGAGTFTIGPVSNCNGSAYSICHTGTTLTFGGPSTFTLSSGLYVGGGSTVTFGSGTTNSYVIGSGASGNAMNLNGGSVTKFADAVGSTFKVVGSVNVVSGGGSCLALPAATQHDIKGSLMTAGGTLLGAGNYTVTGYVALGGNGGGDVSCWGSTLGMSGTGVTLTIGASGTPTSGGCTGKAFCVGAGYGTVSLTAPTSGTYANLAVVGPTATTKTAGALLTEGATTNSISGAFYFPNGAVSLSGGANIGNGTGQCLTLVGSQVTLTGGTSAASSCVTTSSGAASAVLIR